MEIDLNQIIHDIFFLSTKYSKLNSKFLTLSYDLKYNSLTKNRHQEYYALKFELDRLKKNIDALMLKKSNLERIKNTIQAII